MNFEFENIIGFHKNIPAFILCHGPSLDFIKPKLEELKSESILFGVNQVKNTLISQVGYLFRIMVIRTQKLKGRLNIN